MDNQGLWARAPLLGSHRLGTSEQHGSIGLGENICNKTSDYLSAKRTNANNQPINQCFVSDEGWMTSNLCDVVQSTGWDPDECRLRSGVVSSARHTAAGCVHSPGIGLQYENGWM